MKIKPFDAGNWFPINNAVFDEIMPKLSGSGWKVLCVTIRATWGWANPDGGRKVEDIIPYSQFLERSGIVSDHTITAAIRECLDAGYITRREVGRHQGTQKPFYAYTLNTDFEIEISPTAKTAPAATAKTAPAATAKTAPAATAKTALSKRNKQTNDDGGVISLLQQQNIIDSVAREIAQTATVEQVDAWLKYIQTQSLINPTAFLVSRLRLGEWPPEARAIEDATGEDRKRRYAGGKYADLIQH